MLTYIQTAKRTDKMDVSLLRYFLEKLLSILRPPFSEKFQSLLENMITSNDLASDENSPNIKRFLMFISTGKYVDESQNQKAEDDKNNYLINKANLNARLNSIKNKQARISQSSSQNSNMSDKIFDDSDNDSSSSESVSSEEDNILM